MATYLFVSDATIGFVAEQLQRYHPAWISVRTAIWRQGALLRASMTCAIPARCARLSRPYGGRGARRLPYLRILSRL